jgi:AcrR family transcriptional regulator
MQASGRGFFDPPGLRDLPSRLESLLIDPLVNNDMSRVADPRTKIAVLRAAELVFAERGLAGAKVEEIARRAGISKGAFYLHFESKEAALKHVVESFLARCKGFFVRPSEWSSPLPEAAPEVLDFCFERDLRMFEFLWESRAVLRILPTCQGEVEYLCAAFRAEVAQTSREWVEYWKREELYRPEVDADLAATVIGGAYNELVAKMLARGEERPPLEQWLTFAQDTFVRAFGSTAMVDAIARRPAPSRPRIERVSSQPRGTN